MSTTLELPDAVLKALEVDADADEQTLLDAITALKSDNTPEPKALEVQAAEAGKVLLDADTFTALKVGAEAGTKAAKELAEQRFETEFTRALEAGRAVSGQREQLQHFYTLDAEATLKSLAEGPQIVNVKPIGHTYSADNPAPDGVHPESHERHKKILARARDKNVPYMVALEQIMAEDRGEL